MDLIGLYSVVQDYKSPLLVTNENIEGHEVISVICFITVKC